MACPVCGFDPSSPTPSDAIVALRSFPRRYRELVPAPDEEPRPEVYIEAGRAATAIGVLTDDLERVLVTDNATVKTSPSSLDAGSADAGSFDSGSLDAGSLDSGSLDAGSLDSGDPATALDRLAAASTRAADLASRQPPDAWTRTGVRPSGPVTAGELLREAVHAGVHHLRLLLDAA